MPHVQSTFLAARHFFVSIWKTKCFIRLQSTTSATENGQGIILPSSPSTIMLRISSPSSWHSAVTWWERDTNREHATMNEFLSITYYSLCSLLLLLCPRMVELSFKVTRSITSAFLLDWQLGAEEHLAASKEGIQGRTLQIHQSIFGLRWNCKQL